MWLFPGRGCRYVGMAHDIIGRYPAADVLFAQAHAALGYDVIEVCLTGSGRKYVSPRQEDQVIYVVECAYAAVLEHLGIEPRAASGHSLGNFAAACACGAFDFLTGLEVVTRVEELLEEMVDGQGQSMGVIVGLPEREVESLLSDHPGACLANWNSPGQYVIGGTAAGVDAVLAAAAGRGAKQARPLAGGRALHTPLMSDVAAQFKKYLNSIAWPEPRLPLVSSYDASLLRTGDQIREYLGDFLALPVRWESTVQELCRTCGGVFLEIGPGNLLSNMLPFIDRTAKIHTASDILEQKERS